MISGNYYYYHHYYYYYCTTNSTVKAFRTLWYFELITSDLHRIPRQLKLHAVWQYNNLPIFIGLLDLEDIGIQPLELY